MFATVNVDVLTEVTPGTVMMGVEVISKLTEALLLNPETVPEIGLGRHGTTSDAPRTTVVTKTLGEHTMEMLVTFVAPTVPVPLLILHPSPVGANGIVTLYGTPTCNAVGKVNCPLILITDVSEPLSCKLNDAPLFKPDTVPPMVSLVDVQVMETFETFADPTVPVPLLTEHDSPLGCVLTVTA